MRRLIPLVLAIGLVACGTSRSVDDDTAQIGMHRSFVAMQAGDWVKAEQYLLATQAKYPDDPYVLLNLGVVHRNLGQIERARAEWQRLADANSNVVPKEVTNPRYAGKTLSELARDNLAALPKAP